VFYFLQFEEGVKYSFWNDPLFATLICHAHHISKGNGFLQLLAFV
jgi:hypothetical protein